MYTSVGADLPRLMDALPSIPTGEKVEAKTGPLVFDEPTFYSLGAPPPVPASPPKYAAPPPPVPSRSWMAAKGSDDFNPFGNDDEEELPTAPRWALQEYIPLYEGKFQSLQINGLVSGKAFRQLLLTSADLPQEVLKSLWVLADIDKDGALDLEEFVLAMVSYYIRISYLSLARMCISIPTIMHIYIYF